MVFWCPPYSGAHPNHPSEWTTHTGPPLNYTDTIFFYSHPNKLHSWIDGPLSFRAETCGLLIKGLGDQVGPKFCTWAGPNQIFGFPSPIPKWAPQRGAHGKPPAHYAQGTVYVCTHMQGCGHAGACRCVCMCVF
eukprot:TRINITY_DN31969_c0_g1_i1.p1 TRINITY_DN31969_c0_g1~~TRINITY_DN31969_c0_g1_i1.p1  ORF type:complete len:134 (-),score=7.87 TRINITY_DN31969_c0_g1_i1:2342-2743(-)